MKPLHLLTLIFAILTFPAHAQRDGTEERNKFMESLLFTAEAFDDKTPEDQMAPLLAKAVVQGEKVNTEFLDFVSPGLGKAWTNYYLASHRLRIEGRRKGAGGDEVNGATDQLMSIALWKKWREFWDTRRDAVLKKLKVD